MSATRRDRLPLAAYAIGALAITGVGLYGMQAEWIVERELLWIRGSAWCAIVALGLALCATPVGRVLVRLKRTTPARVTRVRRALGITTAALATLHGTLALFTYLRGSWMHLLDLAWLRSGVIALVILVALWVTSYPIVVKRAKVRLWKPLHRLAYVAFALAVHHAMTSPFAPRAWVLSLAAVVAVVALLRFVR